MKESKRGRDRMRQRMSRGREGEMVRRQRGIQRERGRAGEREGEREIREAAAISTCNMASMIIPQHNY